MTDENGCCVRYNGMRMEHHMVVSTVVSAGVWALTRSWPMASSCLVVGILMDGDHVLDYIREFGWRLNLRHLFRVSYERTFNRSWLVLHAWEWMPFICLAAWFGRTNPWIVGAALGWFQHLLSDQFFNTPNPWAYSIIWRWRHGFDHRRTFPFHEIKRAEPINPAARERKPSV